MEEIRRRGVRKMVKEAEEAEGDMENDFNYTFNITKA